MCYDVGRFLSLLEEDVYNDSSPIWSDDFTHTASVSSRMASSMASNLTTVASTLSNITGSADMPGGSFRYAYYIIVRLYDLSNRKRLCITVCTVFA